ncbi:unnamed protein product, partial [Amoebophrya sp. A120]|eukprot:GSA120T00015420001.1
MRLCAQYFLGEEALRASFYILVDLAVSAAPHTGVSTRLLKKALQILESLVFEELEQEQGQKDLKNRTPNTAINVTRAATQYSGNSSRSPASSAQAANPNAGSGEQLQNWVARLNVLVEARTQYKTLANILLGIETLPSEPALLKSHLNRLHSQRHAIMSLVESVELVKLGEEVLHSLSASKYLLRFLEYLAKVTDLMRSTENYQGELKVFDVLAESPEGIVARLLFDLGGAEQAQALAKVMGVDLVEVILHYAYSTESLAP